MKKQFFLSFLTCLIFVLSACTFSSCGKHEEKEIPPTPTTSITIVNNSTVSLLRFTVVQQNSYNEMVYQKDYGTLAPGESQVVPIQVGATRYFMATYDGGWYYSPYYEISITSLSLTNTMLTTWAK